MLDPTYWNDRYNNNQIQWDIHTISTPLKMYFDQITDKNLRILIPGCGNAHEAIYLHQCGFTDVYICDWAIKPLRDFSKKHQNFPKDHIIHADFFDIQNNTFDLLVEQTFFCALNPELRSNYAQKSSALLRERGKLIGLLFNREFEKDRPPFGGNKNEYISLFTSFFSEVNIHDCYNSIPPRAGYELFIKLVK